MTSRAQSTIVSVACFLLGGQALAADLPATADVLGKLHRSNLKEVEMGKMAETQGQSKGVKSFGKILVDDHTAADKKVSQLAKEEKIDLTSNTPAETAEKMPMGVQFDAAFAKSMLDDHKKDVSEAKTARDNTTDPKLKRLLNDIVPVLEKHQSTAQKLVDQNSKS